MKYKFRKKGQVNGHATAYALQHSQRSLISEINTSSSHHREPITLRFLDYLFSAIYLVTLCPACSVHQLEPGKSRRTLPTLRESVTEREKLGVRQWASQMDGWWDV